MTAGQTKGAMTDIARQLSGLDLSEQQMSYVYGYLTGRSKTEAALDAGYALGSAPAVYRSAKVQAAIAAAMDRFLVGELAPAAIHTISRVMADEKTPAGVRAQLALGVLDRAGFSAKRHEKGDQLGKDPSTMTPDELQQQIDKLQAQIEAKMRDITPVDVPRVAQDIDLYP